LESALKASRLIFFSNRKGKKGIKRGRIQAPEWPERERTKRVVTDLDQSMGGERTQKGVLVGRGIGRHEREGGGRKLKRKKVL